MDGSVGGRLQAVPATLQVENGAPAERRADPRRPPPAVVRKATLRAGCGLVLVDISAWGALVEASRPLRPGARVHLQVVTEHRTLVLTAHVLRCSVWSLESNGITYRGGLKFEQRLDLGAHGGASFTKKRSGDVQSPST